MRGPRTGTRGSRRARWRSIRLADGLKVSFLGPERADLEKRVRAWGVGRGDALVIVSLGENHTGLNEAARRYWQFECFGEDDVTIVNGGTMARIAVEKPARSTTLAQPKAGDWGITEERSALLATSEQTAQASEHTNRRLRGALQAAGPVRDCADDRLLQHRPPGDRLLVSAQRGVGQQGHAAPRRLAAPVDAGEAPGGEAGRPSLRARETGRSGGVSPRVPDD